MSKWQSRSLFFALLIFGTATYLINKDKISGDNYAQIVMWSAIMYGGKRTAENFRK